VTNGAIKTLEIRKAAVTKNEKLPADMPVVLVKELLETVTSHYAINKRRSAKHLECRIRHLKPFFGELDANKVSTDDIDNYVKRRQKEGAQNATVNRELAALKRAFRLAFNSKPRKVEEMPKISKLEENAARSGFVEDEQFALLRDAAEPWLRSILVVAYDFGFRMGELLGLRVRQISLKHRTIELSGASTKNKEPRRVKMTDDVHAVVKECIAGKRPDDLVFTRGQDPIKDFRGAWWALCEQTGLGKFVGKKWTGLLFHDLRRSAVRNFVHAGVSEKTVMKISGHKSRSVFDRYNIVSDRDIEEAAVKLQKSRTEARTETLDLSG